MPIEYFWATLGAYVLSLCAGIWFSQKRIEAKDATIELLRQQLEFSKQFEDVQILARYTAVRQLLNEALPEAERERDEARAEIATLNKRLSEVGTDKDILAGELKEAQERASEAEEKARKIRNRLGTQITPAFIDASSQVFSPWIGRKGGLLDANLWEEIWPSGPDEEKNKSRTE